MRKLLFLGLVGLAGQVLANGLFFSEYVEGSSNNKALEIYNATGAAVDLSLVTVNEYGNGAATPSYTVTLSGSLAPEDVYVISHASAVAEVQAVTDINSTVCYYNGDDAVELVYDGATVDVIGVIGSDPGSHWVAGDGYTNEFTLVRNASICDGSQALTEEDWTATGAPQWTAYPQNTFSYLGAHVAACGGGNLPPVIAGPSIDPDPAQPGLMTTVSADVTDDGTVQYVLLHYGLDAGLLDSMEEMLPAGGDAWSATLPPYDACTQVFYQITAGDTEGAVTVSPILNYTVACTLTIAEIQGGVADSPYDGLVVTTSGIVSAIGTSGSGSFFIQDASAEWSGIQVYGSSAVAVGDEVLVTGTVDEYFGQTEVILGEFETLSSGNEPYAPLTLAYSADMGEAHESVRVCFEGQFVCTSEANNYGEALLEDESGELMTDDLFYAFQPTLGGCYELCGVVYFGYGVFRLEPTGEADVVSCDAVSANELVGSFELGHAWPNPFNPSTNLSYTLERSAEARLAVYDLLGREVAVLVDGLVEGGAHVATFEAGSLPSGVYFARLTSEGASATQRLLLVR